jgi:phytoene dehydrogenase-like protein
MGFSDRIIESFFRPFLGGVFLDRELHTSSRMLHFVFRMFSLGDAALPAHGMGAMARQLASRLPPGSIELNTLVEAVSDNAIVVDGQQRRADHVVVACDAPAAAALLDKSGERPEGRTVTCMYFAADTPPITAATLVLNGEGTGPINNLCVPSQVAPTYAPGGQSLVSVTTLEDRSDRQVLLRDVLNQLEEWFGPSVPAWRHLRTYTIDYALPSQAPPALSVVEKPVVRQDGVLVCGDYLDTASIQGAMASGRRAAEVILRAQ